jgi:hypothetical protein
MAQIEAGSAERGRWNRSPPVARIADKHGDWIKVLMAVDGGESHLTQYDRSAYRPGDHSGTISLFFILDDANLQARGEAAASHIHQYLNKERIGCQATGKFESQ